MRYQGSIRRRRRSPFGGRVWRFAVLVLFLLASGAVLLRAARHFPIETLIVGSVFVIALIGLVLYIAELYLIGWVVDFLDGLGVPKFHARSVPLEYEQVGEIIVVTLRDNIATVRDCGSVLKELKRLVDEHHCNFVLDFSYAGRISQNFRPVMVHLMKAARREAKRLGRPETIVAVPRGERFHVFEDRKKAVEEIERQGGNGWVALQRARGSAGSFGL